MKIRLGFVGCGAWARKKYLPYIKSRKNADIVAVSDLVRESEFKLIKEIFPKVKLFSNHEEMLASESLDGVIVSTPHNLHSTSVEKLIQNKIPTLVDKPLSPTYNEALKLVKLAEKKEVFLAVSSQRRASKGIKFLRELISSKKLGEISWINANFCFDSYANWEKTWRNNPELSGLPELQQGLILDAGYHVIDSILYILDDGLPKNIFSSISNRDFNVDIDSSIILEFENGTRVSINLSRNLPKNTEYENYSILGKNGFSTYEKSKTKMGEKSFAFFSSMSDEFIKMNVGKETLLDPLEDFIDYLMNDSDTVFKWSAEKTLNTLRVVEQVYRSIAKQ